MEEVETTQLLKVGRGGVRNQEEQDAQLKNRLFELIVQRQKKFDAMAGSSFSEFKEAAKEEERCMKLGEEIQTLNAMRERNAAAQEGEKGGGTAERARSSTGGGGGSGGGGGGDRTPPVAEKHERPKQIQGMKRSTSSIQGHGVDEPEALEQAMKNSLATAAEGTTRGRSSGESEENLGMPEETGRTEVEGPGLVTPIEALGMNYPIHFSISGPSGSLCPRGRS